MNTIIQQKSKIEIYGAVIVQGKAYNDNEIADLLGKDIRGWKPAGDQGDEETNIVVGDVIFDFLDGEMLEKALAHIKTIG